MKLNGGEFVTGVIEGAFYITIEQESNWSTDGGYSFESVANYFELDKKEAELLINELKEFIGT